MKDRICRDCKQPYTPFGAMRPRCLSCAIAKGRAKTLQTAAKGAKAAAKAERLAVKARKEKLKTRSDWMKEAQAAVNRWVRLIRDAKEPCISCQRHHEGQYHAGHYLSTGARPELRMDLANLHKQCSACNVHLSGNLILYRVNLIAKIGLAEVERLEGPAIPKKYTVDMLKEIKAHYQLLCRNLPEKDHG